jgi:hypothetical protein
MYWCIVRCSGSSNRSSVRFGLATKKSTAQAAADAVAAADAEAEELELAVKVGILQCAISMLSCSVCWQTCGPLMGLCRACGDPSMTLYSMTPHP